ncbi:PASTA domain-containing protein [Alloprevotella sp. OH1205_COT-284]|uniref:penicillin-binding transpeptidase domain-containing protein n=1 Tax=Alloprevotella sp. OH1205_COT-284 TaxID=2491043 RepID=UPI000F5EBAFB|nr:penicillin-binding transpeptidase domain-containing protein [Alloprevotella sp. OH1205_COT-284]RRD77738.1 PASTA domain-containing protein [Alloprevotella sp. OH1205_COT-284]
MKKTSPNFLTEKIMPRYGILGGIFVVVFIIILARVGYIMIGEHEYWEIVNDRYESNRKIMPAKRGDILAADGRVLATSLPEYLLFLDPMSWEPDSARRVKDQHRRDSILYNCIDSIVDGMKAVIPELNTEKLRKNLLEGRKARRHNIKLHSRRVSYIQLTELKKLPLLRLGRNIGGFYQEEFHRRKRPFGDLANRTIGKFHPSKDMAFSGLELAYDSILTGRPGVYHRERVGGLPVQIIDTLPEDGCDLVTTLDVETQDIVENVLRDHLRKLDALAGMCILMEVKSGDIKAISSISRLKNRKYAEIEPRAVTNLMEPGSVVKPMSFMVAMDDGKITMKTTFDTGSGVREMYGRKMRDANWRKGGDGMLSVPEMIKKSSNVGVSALIDRAYASNPDRFVEGLYRIGIAEDLHIPIPGYKKPRIRFRREDPSRWYRTTLPWMSVGYETQIPPISTLTFYNGVANGGKLVCPRFVSAIRRGDEVVEEFPTKVLREQMCKPEVLRNIQICLEGVVGKNTGTGAAAYSKYFSIAGKTGTAQIWERGRLTSRYLVSFAGYFPANKPRYSMIVCIEKEYPAYGGGHCGPIFKKVAEAVIARQLNTNYAAAIDSTDRKKDLPHIHPGNLSALHRVLDALELSPSTRHDDRANMAWGYNAGGKSHISLTPERPIVGVPSVLGYGLRDAVYRLERLGLKVKAQGMGRVVQQSVSPGTPLRKKMTIKLTLSPEDKPEKPADSSVPPTPHIDSAQKDTTRKSEKTPSSSFQKTTPLSTETQRVHTEKSSDKKP